MESLKKSIKSKVKKKGDASSIIRFSNKWPISFEHYHTFEGSVCYLLNSLKYTCITLLLAIYTIGFDLTMGFPHKGT
jgi:hypothetical protein